MTFNYYQTTDLSGLLDRYEYCGDGKAQNLNLLGAAQDHV
jgi:hypothetical protein